MQSKKREFLKNKLKLIQLFATDHPNQLDFSNENFELINAYIGPCLRKLNGFIDTYFGGAIMAFFSKKTSDVIDAAIEMLEELQIDFK